MKKIIVKNLGDYNTVASNIGYILSLDTETTSLDYEELQLEGISLCDGKMAVYIDFTQCSQESIKLIKRELSFYLLKKDLVIFHNTPFDLKVLRKEGISCTENIYDTMVAIHLLNENSTYGLKDCANRVLNVPKSEIKSYKDIKDLSRSDPEFYDYALNDAIWTYQLWEKTAPALIKADLEELFYDIEMPFQFVLRNMEINGLCLDTKKSKEYQKQLKQIIKDTQTNMLKELKINWLVQSNFLGGDEYISPVNFNSGSKQLAEVLLNRFHCELPTTKKGNYSVDDSVLQIHSHIPFVKYLLQYRQAKKLASTYIDKFASFEGERYRGSFNDCGTRTGRISSNFQQFPKEISNDLGINVRECIVSSPGNDLIVMDYSGQELRGLAHVSQDEVMLEAFRDNYDLHLTTANSCFELGIPKDELCENHPNYNNNRKKYNTDRDKGKNKINFPIAYGTTAYGISANLGVSVEQAETYLSRFFEVYPNIKPAITQCSKDLRAKGCVRTEIGRYRRLKAIYSSNKWESAKAKRQAFNHLIQGLFADVLRIATSECLKLSHKNPSWKLKIILLVHDEVVFEVSEKYTKQALQAIKLIAESAYKISVDLPVEIKSGKVYGKIK